MDQTSAAAPPPHPSEAARVPSGRLGTGNNPPHLTNNHRRPGEDEDVDEDDDNNQKKKTEPARRHTAPSSHTYGHRALN